MTKEDLNRLLAPLIGGKGIGATVNFVLGSDKQATVKRADVEEKTQIIIRDQFVAALKDNILKNKKVKLISLRKSDERKDAVYEYDYKEFPEGISVIDVALNARDPQWFSFSKDELTNLKALIIIIGNDEFQLALFKRMYPINLLKRDSTLKVIHKDMHFVALNSDVVMINDSFDFIKIREHLFILNIATLEQVYGFHKLIKKRAKKCIDDIAKAQILEEPKVFEPMLEDVAFARKIAKVTIDSPVLDSKIPVERIIRFTQTHPALKGKFKYNEDNTRIILHTKQAIKLFLKLLNDDYLISELTSQHYDSFAKDLVPKDSEKPTAKAADIKHVLSRAHS